MKFQAHNIFCEPAPTTGVANNRRRHRGPDDTPPGAGGGTSGTGAGFETYAGNVLETEDGQAIKLE